MNHEKISSQLNDHSQLIQSEMSFSRTQLSQVRADMKADVDNVQASLYPVAAGVSYLSTTLSEVSASTKRLVRNYYAFVTV